MNEWTNTRTDINMNTITITVAGMGTATVTVGSKYQKEANKRNKPNIKPKRINTNNIIT